MSEDICHVLSLFPRPIPCRAGSHRLSIFGFGLLCGYLARDPSRTWIFTTPLPSPTPAWRVRPIGIHLVDCGCGSGCGEPGDVGRVRVGVLVVMKRNDDDGTTAPCSSLGTFVPAGQGELID